jgi:L-rhamnose mutarotase
MHRIAFSLTVPRANLAEYQRRHEQLWPELVAAIAAQGGHNYSIFAIPDLDRVVGYVEVEDLERWQAGGGAELTHRWWRYMAEIMPANPDYSPLADDIYEVFHLD